MLLAIYIVMALCGAATIGAMIYHLLDPHPEENEYEKGVWTFLIAAPGSVSLVFGFLLILDWIIMTFFY